MRNETSNRKEFNRIDRSNMNRKIPIHILSSEPLYKINFARHSSTWCIFERVTINGFDWFGLTQLSHTHTHNSKNTLHKLYTHTHELYLSYRVSHSQCDITKILCVKFEGKKTFRFDKTCKTSWRLHTGCVAVCALQSVYLKLTHETLKTWARRLGVYGCQNIIWDWDTLYSDEDASYSCGFFSLFA